MAASVETWLLTHLPNGLLIAAIVLLCVGLALGGQVLVRRSVELSRLEAHQEVAGFILAVVGVVYAVLLTFVVITVWEQFESARAEADRESTVVLALYRDAAALAGIGPDARPAIRTYAQRVVDDEWPTMAERHEESPSVDAALGVIWSDFRAMSPQTESDKAFYDAAVDGLHDIDELRRARIDASGSELLTPMWTVLIVGGIISVAFTYFFGVRNFAAQALMVGALAALIGLVLALILALDLPYTGDVAVGPDRMQDAIAEFTEISG